jgi:hypothetical protein
VTLTREAVTCAVCVVMLDEALAAGVVRLKPWGVEHQVEPVEGAP